MGGVDLTGLPDDVSETELLELARRQGLGRLRRGLPAGVLRAIVAGLEDVRPEHLSGVAHTRERLERYIAANLEAVRGQLPGCDGRCSTYPCSDVRHVMCYLPNRRSA